MAATTDFEEEKNRINSMSREEMARLWRFAPAGHPYFDSSGPYWKIFKERFDSLGGWSPSVSKSVGWDQ